MRMRTTVTVYIVSFEKTQGAQREYLRRSSSLSHVIEHNERIILTSPLPSQKLSRRNRVLELSLPAAFSPDANSLVQMTDNRIATTITVGVNTTDKPSKVLRKFAILSWLNATRIKGIDTAADMLTIGDVSEETKRHSSQLKTYTYTSARN